MAQGEPGEDQQSSHCADRSLAQQDRHVSEVIGRVTDDLVAQRDGAAQYHGIDSHDLPAIVLTGA